MGIEGCKFPFAITILHVVEINSVVSEAKHVNRQADCYINLNYALILEALCEED